MFRHLDWFSHISRNTLLGKLKWKNITPGKITTAYLVFCCYTQATNNFITRTQTRAHSRTLTESVIILSSCEDRDWQEVTKVAHVHCDGKRGGRCHIKEHLLHLWDGKKEKNWSNQSQVHFHKSEVFRQRGRSSTSAASRKVYTGHRTAKSIKYLRNFLSFPDVFL